jgi:hypothetical protein
LVTVKVLYLERGEVTATEILTLLGGSSGTVAILMLALFITGHVVPKGRIEEMRGEIREAKEERDEWKKIAENERLRSDASVAAGQVVRDVMIALRKELQ